MIAYIDTNVALLLAEGRRKRIGKKVISLLSTADLLISPMVLLELEYLYEKGRSRWPSGEVQLKMDRETPVRVCALPFATIARVALNEKWTRDAFDRIIVAQAKANGMAFLISSDERMAEHYPRTVW